MTTAREESEGPRASRPGTTPANTGAYTDNRTMTMAIDAPTNPATTRYCGSTSRTPNAMETPDANGTKRHDAATPRPTNKPHAATVATTDVAPIEHPAGTPKRTTKSPRRTTP